MISPRSLVWTWKINCEGVGFFNTAKSVKIVDRGSDIEGLKEPDYDIWKFKMLLLINV